MLRTQKNKDSFLRKGYILLGADVSNQPSLSVNGPWWGGPGRVEKGRAEHNGNCVAWPGSSGRKASLAGCAEPGRLRRGLSSGDGQSEGVTPREAGIESSRGGCGSVVSRSADAQPWEPV